MKVTIEKIEQFRTELEREMRELNGKNGDFGITEEQIVMECRLTSDAHIERIIRDGTTPKEWAEFITT